MTSRHLAETGFLALLLCGVLMQRRATRAARAGRPLTGRPVRVGEAVSSAMTTRTGKVVVLGVWWWLGWHFLAR